MTSAALLRLASRLPSGAIVTDPEATEAAATDLWTLDLLRRVRGDRPDPPEAVVTPGSIDDVVAVLRWASETRCRVVPRGGGSGVCGAARAGAGSIVLDMSRMDRVLEIDQVSHAVRVEAGIRGDALEAVLAPHGLTVGHYPQSIAISSVGGWIAAASAGQASAGYGAVEDLLLGLTAVLSNGEVLRLRAIPRSAMGPDLRRLLVGSEGAFAVVTEATLACSRLPTEFEWDHYGFGSFDDAVEWVRSIVQAGVRPLVVRAYDEVDATLAFGRIGHGGGPVAIVGIEGPGAGERRRVTREAATRIGASVLDQPDYGEHWWAHRNDAVGLYRRVMGEERMFGPGVVVDTLEVAALWRDVPALSSTVRVALLEYAEAVGCHLSHPYGSGASLYFTFVVRGQDDHTVEEPYGRAWDAAARACLAANGTFSHHHGVGALKARYLGAELGAAAVGMLRRIKEAWDPADTLNPARFTSPDGE